MEPNLARIPADGDTRAEAIIQRADGTVSSQILESLDNRDVLALGRYGARQPTVALREHSSRRLHDALLATVLSQLGRQRDPADLMVGLAVHHLVAQQIGVLPSSIFDNIAARLPDGPLPDMLRRFGARQDVTAEAFGRQLIQTADGPDFIPAP